MKNNIDVIIVNYKSTPWLLSCLRSVYDAINEIKVGVYIYDNSPEDNNSHVKEAFPDVTLIKNDRNIGFAAAVNKGLKKTTAPYVMLLNPDTQVHNGIFRIFCNYLDKNPSVGIVGPKILNHDGSIQGSARSFPTPLTGLFGRTSLLSGLFPKNRLTKKNILNEDSDGKTPLGVDWVSGACMVARRDAFNDSGLLDERFFMYWEDADWCRRIGEHGWQIIYLPEATVIHLIGKSSLKKPIKTQFEFHKSAYYLYIKNAKGGANVLTPVVFLGLAMRFYFFLVRNLFACH